MIDSFIKSYTQNKLTVYKIVNFPKTFALIPCSIIKILVFLRPKNRSGLSLPTCGISLGISIAFIYVHLIVSTPAFRTKLGSEVEFRLPTVKEQIIMSVVHFVSGLHSNSNKTKPLTALFD